MESKTKIIIGVSIIIVVLAALYWYIRPPRPVAPGTNLDASQGGAPSTLAPQGQDLGSTLYEKATNPVQGKLPDAVAPVPNPIEGIYKNPFE